MDARERLQRARADSPRYEARGADDGSDGTEEIVSARAFGYVRGQHDRAAILTLKTASGNECSLQWHWSPDVVYVPGHAVPLTLVYSSRGFKVEILGENLDLLAAYLQQGRVVWIKASDRLHHLGLGTDEAAGFVESFHIVPIGEGEDVELLSQALHLRYARPVRPRETADG